jgi:acyl-CoA dehydrogenase
MSPQVEAIATKELTASEGFQRALEIATQNAEDVDRRARFPSEAVDALRAAGALGWYVPRNLGGAGAHIDELATATYELSRQCAATGMVFAMHQIQVASIVRHAADSVWFETYLRRLVREQRLIASATSEVGVGGDVRRSIAAVQPVADSSGDLIQFEKKASTISYGAHAEDLLTTVRRAPNADPGDQVMVLTHLSEMDVKQTSQWDTLGMRGTCSPGFIVGAKCSADQVLPTPFSTSRRRPWFPSRIFCGRTYGWDSLRKRSAGHKISSGRKPGRIPEPLRPRLCGCPNYRFAWHTSAR